MLGVLSAPLALGGTAVSLFFVISGYCIHRSFAIQLAADPAHEPGWRAYFIRRAWRIYPVLIAVMLITLLLDQLTIHRYPDDLELGSLSFHTMLVNLCALQGLVGLGMVRTARFGPCPWKSSFTRCIRWFFT